MPDLSPHLLSSQKYLPHVSRLSLRDRLIRYGAQKLSNADLIAIMISHGKCSPDHSLSLSKQILHRTGSLHLLAQTEWSTLCSLPGVGPATASRLIAAFELACRIGNPLRHHKTHECSLADLARNQWDQEGLLVMAYSEPEDLNISTEQIIASALTLSLHSSLDDQASHAHWLTKLVGQGSHLRWSMIVLRPEDELLGEEERGANQLFKLAHFFDLKLIDIRILSTTKEWLLNESDFQRGEA